MLAFNTKSWMTVPDSGGGGGGGGRRGDLLTGTT